MVLGTKSEERIRELLKEYIDERRQTIDDKMITHTFGIFSWGVLCGVIVAYTSLWPFLIGTVIGYYSATKDITIIKRLYSTSVESINSGYQHLLATSQTMT
jgi:hypothetical protein